MRYCLGKVEAASSSVARIFLERSSGDNDKSKADGVGGVTAARTGGSAVGTEEQTRRKDDGRVSGNGSSNGDGVGTEASREEEEQEGRRGGDESGGFRREEEGEEDAERDSAKAPLFGDGDAPSSEAADEGEKKRRLFLEFYGPIVGVFSALGFPAWLSELLTVVATQLCPLLAAMPLLRLSSRGGGGGRGDGDGGGAGAVSVPDVFFCLGGAARSAALRGNSRLVCPDVFFLFTYL